MDGVLNCRYTERLIFSFLFVSPEKIELLKQLVEHTGARIVLSSTWRYGWADIETGKDDTTDAKCFLALKTELQNYGLELLDYTPVTSDDMYQRGTEIEMWLNAWKGESIESFVILDDLNGRYLRPHAGKLVQTSMSKGLQQVHIEKAIKLLNKT